MADQLADMEFTPEVDAKLAAFNEKAMKHWNYGASEAQRAAG